MSKSAEKSLAVLKIVGFSERPLGLLEIAALACLDKSTTARLLAGLESAGFIQRDPGSRCYSSGPMLVSLSSFAMGQIDIVKVARSELDRLGGLTGETVSLHIRQGLNRVCVDGIESKQDIRRAVPWGGQLPLHEGPSGKAITAFLPSDVLDEVMRRAVLAEVDMGSFLEALEKLQKQRFILGIGDRTRGIGAISVPVFDRDGVVGSVTVAGPSERWNILRMEQFVDEMLWTSQSLSGRLGARMETLTGKGV